MTIHEAFKENIDYYVAMGKHFGYPDCCINQFIETTGALGSSQERVVAADGTGFLPCDKHAKQILDGKIKLEDLIKHRQAKSPFPNDR